MTQKFKQDKCFIEKSKKMRLIIQQGITDIFNPKLKISRLRNDKDEEEIILFERKDEEDLEEN